MQKAFDELYQQSKNGNNFYKLLEIIGSEQNICLAYRNLKTNSGSKTAGTDGKTIEDQEYHRQVAYIILDSYGKMIMEECQNGFDEKTKQKLHELMKTPEQREQEYQKYKERLEHYQKFFENGTYERSWESGTEENYNMVDGQVNNLKSAEGKRVERKPAQSPEQSSKKKPKKRESVIKRLREKQIAIAVKSGKPVPRYLEQDMERRRG